MQIFYGLRYYVRISSVSAEGRYRLPSPSIGAAAASSLLLFFSPHLKREDRLWPYLSMQKREGKGERGLQAGKVSNFKII